VERLMRENKLLTRCVSAAILLLAGITLLGLGSCATSQKPQETQRESISVLEEPLPIDPHVSIGRLENGLTYYIRSNSEPKNRAELRLVVNAGSILEEEHQQGIAHYLEHLAFNGTKNFAKHQIVDYLESLGVRFGPDLNAYTSFDETVYRLQVPTENEETLETALQILEDWAHNILFTEEEVEKERGVIIEEWRLGRGADARIRDKQIPILFKDSRYADRRPIGKLEYIKTFQAEDFRRFYNEWYRPDLMAVIAVGDFDPSRMEQTIRKLFSRLEPVADPSERKLYPLPDHKETLFAIASDAEATESRLSIITKHDVQPFNTVGDYRRILVEALYHRMLNDRLGELTRKPDAPFLDAYSGKGRLVRTKDFYILGARVSDGGFERGIEALLTESKRAREFGFTATELERTKREILKRIEQYYNERDKTHSAEFVREYIDHYLENEPIPGIEYEFELYKEFIPEITLQEVNSLASEWLSEENRVMLISAPEKAGVPIPKESDLLAVFDRVEKRQITAYVDRTSDAPLLSAPPAAGSITAEQTIDGLGVKVWTLSNGARVVLKPTDFKNDEVLFNSYSPGGTSLVEDRDFIAAETAVEAVTEGGIGSFTLIELEKKLAGKAVHVSPWISGLFEGIRGSSRPEDLESMFQLIYLYFTSPRKDSSAFLAYRQRLEGKLQNRMSSPEEVFWDTVLSAISQDHFRYRPWTTETLREMDLERSYKIYQDRFADASDFTFFFVGSLDLERIKPLVTRYLGGLPSLRRRENWRDLGVDPPQGVVEQTIKKGTEQKSQVQIVFNGSFEWTLKEVITMKALAEVLDIRLRENIREEEGGTYSIGAFASPSHYPDEEFHVFVGFGCAPEQAETLSRLVFQDVRDLQANGPRESDVTKVKEILKRERETNLRSNDFWVDVLRSYFINEQDPHLILDYSRMVEEITSASLQRAAIRYLNTQRYVKVTLYPETWGE
jgi:zinc protease